MPSYLYTKESIPFADKKASISLQIFFALGFSILKTIRAFFKISISFKRPGLIL